MKNKITNMFLSAIIVTGCTWMLSQYAQPIWAVYGLGFLSGILWGCAIMAYLLVKVLELE